MPKQLRSMKMPRFLAGLVVVLMMLLCAGSLQARDMVEYGRYLGVRLQMWEESYEVLDKIIDSGTAEEKSRAMRSRAEVMRTEADVIFNVDQDEGARFARYEAALKIFGNPEDSPGVVAKGLMLLDLAMSLRRTDRDRARTYCEDAAKLFDPRRKALEQMRISNPEQFEKEYADYSRIFFHYCRSFYIKAMTYDAGSEPRTRYLKECENWLLEFLFSLGNPTEEQVLSYALEGDIELARGRAESAASKFTDLVNFLAPEPPTAYIGRLALQHGYLRAAELLTTELEFDPKSLERCVALYAEAFAKYGQISELDFYFKRFQLYRISALIKLGDEAQIRGAIDLLFKLSEDRDVSFRRQALIVLADIATRGNLDDELRFRCAGAVYKDMLSNPPSVNLKCIQAYQSLLLACRDVRTFETFAPTCFARIGELYEGMWRFLEAALIYREGCFRTSYFEDKFPADGAVPEHMRGRTEKITDGKTLHGFPAEMANLFARNANFLIHPEFGEPANDYFRSLATQSNNVKASFGGETALMELAYRSALDMYTKGQFHQAAVRMVNLPANFRSFPNALYVGAKAYYRVVEDTTSSRHNRRGEQNNKDNRFLHDVETPEWLQEQRDRHAGDLDGLPASMTAGFDAHHWDAILDSSTSDGMVNWHKSAYFYKKYFLIEGKRAWAEISEALEGVENPGIADVISAIADVRNAKWAAENPGGEGAPDPDMRRIGMAVYDLATLQRLPPRRLTDAERETIREQERELALGLLRPFWKNFGPHLKDNLAYQEAALRLSFDALAESGDAENAERAYLAYAEAFPDRENELRRMVAGVYSLLLTSLTPRNNALARGSSVLISRANLLKKNSFERINASVNEAWAADAKRLEEAKGQHARRVVLAEHFWNRWMIELLFDGEKNADIQEFLPDLKATVEAKWNEMAEVYPARWAKAVRAEFDTRIKHDSFSAVRDEVKKAIAGGTDYEIVDKLRELQDAEMKKGDGDTAKIQLLAELQTAINTATSSLAYFTGTLYIYELGNFLDALSVDVNERARPATTRILKYYEEYRMRRGQGGPESLDERAVKLLGTQYYRIRDWRNTIKYHTAYVERFGGERAWGRETEIPVDQRTKAIGRTTSGNELEIKYQLGKAHLELFKERGDIEDLKKAALLMRRCWCFNRVRDANELNNKSYSWVKKSSRDEDTDLQKAVEDYYLAVGTAMSEIFLLLHKADNVSIAWPAYADQFTRTLEVKKEGGKTVTQSVPKDKAQYLWEASQIHLLTWASFRLLSEYSFRSEFRSNLESWLKLTVTWLETYGAKDTSVEEIKGEAFKKFLQDSYNTAMSEGSRDATHLPDEMKEYLKRLNELAKQIASLASKNGVTLTS